VVVPFFVVALTAERAAEVLLIFASLQKVAGFPGAEFALAVAPAFVFPAFVFFAAVRIAAAWAEPVLAAFWTSVVAILAAG